MAKRQEKNPFIVTIPDPFRYIIYDQHLMGMNSAKLQNCIAERNGEPMPCDILRLFPPFDVEVFAQAADGAADATRLLAERRLRMHRFMAEPGGSSKVYALMERERASLYKISLGSRRQRWLWCWSDKILARYYDLVRRPKLAIVRNEAAA